MQDHRLQGICIPGPTEDGDPDTLLLLAGESDSGKLPALPAITSSIGEQSQ
jgi:hypothetical protein